MGKFMRRTNLFALLNVAAFAVLLGCGNKGSLFLITEDELLQQISTIDDALEELEVMESEEESGEESGEESEEEEQQ